MCDRLGCFVVQEHILGALPPVGAFPKLISAKLLNITNETTGLVGCYVALAYDVSHMNLTYYVNTSVDHCDGGCGILLGW